MNLRGFLYRGAPLIIAALACAVCARNANEFYTFKDATATSTYITQTDDAQKFGPARAFQIGASYWCSAGHHSSTDFVSWTGELWDTAKIAQVEVLWAYAPQEVEIAVSISEDSFTVVMPFRETFESKPSYKEVFKLDAAVEARFIRLTLRGSVNEYFGIREVHVVGAGSPLFILKSGISTPLGEMCLQLEEGRMDNNTRVVLDLCTHAIAAADGRDLWRHDSRQRIVSAVSVPPKCLTSVSPSRVGALVIADCKDDGEDVCRWEFMGNSQISLKTASELCITQEDRYSDKAGMGNLLEIMKEKVKATASSTTDKHGIEFIMDNDVKTYWASELFLDASNHNVTITLDFGEPVHAARVKIDWEYQPMAYTLEGSTDKTVYKELARNVSNSDHVTIDSLRDEEFRQLRLVLLRPHYSMGKVSGGFVYGIRDMQVLSSNLQTVIGDCRAAANSADARDKYFVSYVGSFEPKLAHDIKNMEGEIHGDTGEIIDEMAALTETVDSTDSCMQEKKDYGKALSEIETSDAAVWKQIQHSLLCPTSAKAESTYSGIGETMSNPAEDCYVIKQHTSGATSGFYWIHPKCAKHPLRVYCDMHSRTSMFLWTGKGDSSSPQTIANMKSPLAIRYECASYGLEPLVVRSKHQVEGLKEALYLMGFERKVDHYVPLAYRFGNSHKFRDLMNIYSFMAEPGYIDLKGADDAHTVEGAGDLSPETDHNAAGLSLSSGEIEKFDLESGTVEAIVCSTNVTDDMVMPVELHCDDRVDKTDSLVSNINTNIVVRCSEDCSGRKELPVYGVDGLYSDRSSICRAAIHSGTIAARGTFTISVESGLAFYSGNTENGIESYAYNKSWQGSKDILDPIMPDAEKEVEHTGPPSKYSVRILPLERTCPIVQTHGSFLQVHQVDSATSTKSAKSDPNQPSEAHQSQAASSTEASSDQSVGVEVLDIADLDPTTKSAALKVLCDMNALYGFDPKSVVNTVENIAAVVSRARKYVKPLESITHHQEKSLTTLFDRVELGAHKALHLKETKAALKTNYQRLVHEQQSRGLEASTQFKLDYVKMSFSKSFKVYDTSMTSGGPSRWGYSDAPFEGHSSYMVQSSDIDSALPGEGAFAMLRNRRYFDFDLQVQVLSKNEGSVGVAFRVQDQFNFYLFTMNSRHSNKQLLKVQDGVVHVIATNPDEGFVRNRWFNIHVSVSHYTIEVSCDSRSVIRVLDTSFEHGGVGVYSCGSHGDFYFDNLSVTPKAALMSEHDSHIARLKTLKCCTYNETFTGDFSHGFSVVNPNHAHTTSWRFKDILGGKHRAIHQHHPSQDVVGLGSVAILKNDRLCSSGYLRFRFLPQCEGGVIGAAVRYADSSNTLLVELSASELRIRLLTDGQPKVLSSVPASFAVSKWNVIEVFMESKSVSVKVVNDVEFGSFLTSLFKTANFECTAEIGDAPKLGLGLGLKSSACDSCYFDTVEVSPDPLTSVLPATNFVQEFSSASVWRPCVENVHILSRVSLCKQMYRNKGNANVCAESFCSPCCSYHTMLLGDGHHAHCVSECQKNNHVVQSYLERFLSYVSSCVTLKGAAFDHCEGDGKCLKDACKLCCGSGHDAHAPLDKHLIALETASCINQCNSLL